MAGTRLVQRRHPLHRRGLQGGRQAHLPRGAALPDPAGLFNAGFGGKVRRAIDLHEGDTLDEAAFKALIRAAAAANREG